MIGMMHDVIEKRAAVVADVLHGLDMERTVTNQRSQLLLRGEGFQHELSFVDVFASYVPSLEKLQELVLWNAEFDGAVVQRLEFFARLAVYLRQGEPGSVGVRRVEVGIGVRTVLKTNWF
jgi:hypothetical protein